MTLDFTKLAYDYIGEEVYRKDIGAGVLHDQKVAVLGFAKFLNERASREECPHPFDECPGGEHCKPTKSECLACTYNECNGNDDAKVHTCKREEQKKEYGVGLSQEEIVERDKFWATHTCPKPTPSKAECEHETGGCILCYRPPSKALEELELFAVGGSVSELVVIAKINELVRYVKELEKKL